MIKQLMVVLLVVVGVALGQASQPKDEFGASGVSDFMAGALRTIRAHPSYGMMMSTVVRNPVIQNQVEFDQHQLERLVEEARALMPLKSADGKVTITEKMLGPLLLVLRGAGGNGRWD